MRPSELLPSTIRTKRLVLRRQHPSDAQLVKDAVDSSIAHLQRSVAWAQAAPMSLAALAAQLTHSAAAFDADAA